MKIVGKYSFVKRDKDNNILYKETKHNVITKNGQSQILKLFQNSMPNSNFKNMIGYDVLDLSSYKVKPVFSNNDTTYVTDDYYNYMVSDDYSQTQPTIDTWTSKQWTVQSSFFLNKKWDTQSRLKLNKVMSTGDYNDRDYSFNAYSIIKNDSFSYDDVDAILQKDHKTYVNWSGYRMTDDNSYLLYQNVQNIDFFRVYCRQRVIAYRSNITVQLWRGRLYNQSQLSDLKVIYKTDLNSTKNLCMKVKHRKLGSEQQFTTISDYVVNTTDGSITLTSSAYPSDHDTNNAWQIIIEYYVHYKDSQLDNGICGMYLDYDHVTKNSNNLFSNRAFFGNGIFSSDGGNSWDSYMCFPWQGTPKTFGSYRRLRWDTNMRWFNDYNGVPSMMTLQQNNDGVNEHFYSFYPYVYKSPTNFQFLTLFRDQKIKIKNFLFLIPKFQPQVPRVFVFGDGTSQQTVNDTQLDNQCLRTDAISCTSQEGSLIQWKTLLDFDDANDFTIKQVGLNFGDTHMKLIKGNWYCLSTIDKDQCNTLFSRMKLDNPITKTNQQTLQVTYEIEVF